MDPAYPQWDQTPGLHWPSTGRSTEMDDILHLNPHYLCGEHNECRSFHPGALHYTIGKVTTVTLVGKTSANREMVVNPEHLMTLMLIHQTYARGMLDKFLA